MDTTQPEEKGLPQETKQEIKIERPKRAKITEAEAIKWTEEFAAKRKERFIASVYEKSPYSANVHAYISGQEVSDGLEKGTTKEKDAPDAGNE